MKAYKTKAKRLAGTSYPEIKKKAFGYWETGDNWRGSKKFISNFQK